MEQHETTWMSLPIAPTVGEMVVADYRKAEVFRKFGIDYCCGGKKSLEETCRKKNIDPALVQAELDALDQLAPAEHTLAEGFEPDALADYIVAQHHRYVSQSLPILYELTAKVARVHGERHTELVEIFRLFKVLGQELEMHMLKEEQVLFPYIRRLSEARRTGVALPAAPFGTVQNPIRMMESEHEFAGESMEDIRRLSQDYTPPADACTSYRVLFAKLDEFEQDLHRHVHLENNILFPKAIELEG